ncbi:ABC transporter ATP-binding protein [Hamadaea tsunoensis]|uniref:ABC transporter ATP-binding protein n=1 Tax=Hamadaea tsunoensis TaxID=53368 RepID=UPI00040FBBC4|nr:ABC transporter ATP-binding protein [Hamadaea tsunoensis]
MAAIGVTCRGLVSIYRLEGYDVVALAGVDLDIAPGESVALLGPSGSGKSTLLSVLAGLMRPAAGRAHVGEVDLAKAGEPDLAKMRSAQVGVALQGAQRNLLPYLTAEQNVRFAQRGAVRGGPKPPSAREVLNLVGMAGRGRMRLKPGQLTPGERQRLALAVALANRPGLLLADEPTSQLDTNARDDVLAALDSVHRNGTTVIVVTHDPDVGARMGRTVTIRDGRVGGEGRSGEEFAVVGRDGSVHLPADVLEMLPPGTYLRVIPQKDGSALLVPADSAAAVAAAEVSSDYAPTGYAPGEYVPAELPQRYPSGDTHRLPETATSYPVQSVPSQWNSDTRQFPGTGSGPTVGDGVHTGRRPADYYGEER